MEAEQFSLCWNNFHSNLSAGFHTLLRDEDLVDVTLAAEGRYLKAHKTVLSVCSPYFKELFRANPCDHPIVILHDIKYNALRNLLEFMYQGEVSVSQEDIPTFMRVADVLKIKGLSEHASSGEFVSENGIAPMGVEDSSERQLSKRKKDSKKIIKPIQHLRPIGSMGPIGSIGPIGSLGSIKSPDAKLPKLDMDATPNTANNVTPKAEPLDEEFSDAYDEQVNSKLSESSSDYTKGNCSGTSSWMDTSSPGGLYFLKSRRGHPVLIHGGHIYTLSHKGDAKSTWVCVKQKTLSCEGCCVTTTSAGGAAAATTALLSYSGHNHAQLNDVIERLQGTSCSPTAEL